MTLDRSPIALYTRLTSLVVLVHGLVGAVSLLGLAGANNGPALLDGSTQFYFGLAFVLARLIGSVGLWTYAIWGLSVIAGAYGAEIMMFFIAPRMVSIDFFGFLLRLGIMGAVVLLLLVDRMQRRQSAAD